MASLLRFSRLISRFEQISHVALPRPLILERCYSNNPVPSEVDVVVIGGGAIGCSTLYHLAKQGVTNTVLLEKDKLTSGTTWHTAGLLWNIRHTDTEINLVKTTRALLLRLEEESGIAVGFKNDGGLFTAPTKERLDEYIRLSTFAKAFGREVEILSPSETKRRFPLVEVDDLYGCIYTPTDGDMDPATYCDALTRVSSRAGAKVITDCSVNDIETTVDDFGVRRVNCVRTSLGDIKTKVVVNASGVWAPSICSMVDLTIPLIAKHHAYVVTSGIEGMRGMPNIRDHDYSIYFKVNGDSVCFGGYENHPITWEKVQHNFAFGLFDLDWDVFQVHVDSAVHRMPAIGKAGIVSTVCGPESFTPDHKPLLGEDTILRGFYHACGMNSMGMLLSGGCGEQLAHWIINGRPTLDMFSFDIRRFHPDQTRNSQWVKERTHESYSKTYAIQFPHDQPLAGRELVFKDPLFDIMTANKCVFQDTGGWERSGWFALEHDDLKLKPYDYYGAYGNDVHQSYGFRDILHQDYTFEYPKHHDVIGRECLSCREKAAVFNLSYFGKFYLHGPDAQKTADWIFSGNMQKELGDTVYTCMLNKRGGIEADITVTVVGENNIIPGVEPHIPDRGFYIATGGASATYCLTHILQSIQDRRFACDVVDLSQHMGILSVQGPRSIDILSRLTDTPLSNDHFPFSTSKLVNIDGMVCRAMRLTFVGELGWELHIPLRDIVRVYEVLKKAGAEFGIVDSGGRATESLSAEKGFKHWHADVRSDDSPLEAGLAFTCKLKGSLDFLGRAALEEKREFFKSSGGPTRKLICLTSDSQNIMLGSEVIYRNGVLCGFVRRAAFAYALNSNIAYGYISRDNGDPVSSQWLRQGTYQIENKGKMFDAVYHTKSPFDPKNMRMKGDYSIPLSDYCIA